MKYLFEKAYREGNAPNYITEDGVRYSIASNEDIVPSEEQKTLNIQDVASMDSVYAIDASKLVPGEKSIKDIYRDYFTTWGENIHSDLFGDIAVKNSSIRSEMRHGSTPVKVASIEAIPSVIHNGKIVECIKKDSGVLRIVVAAPVKIGDAPYFMGVMLQRDSQNQRLYLHDVVIEKEASGSASEHLDSTGPHAENENLYTSSILDKIVEVKRNREYGNTYSLSDAGKRYDNGVALEETSADDLAPVRKDLIQKPEAPGSREELAPVGENVRRNDGSAPQEAEAPAGDGLTQAQEELLQMPEENPYAEKLVAKWENSRAEAENLERLREEALASYDQKVEALQAQYDGKKNKDTKTARELLRRIERLKRLRADADADYKNVIESGYREGAIKTPAFKMKTGRPDSQRLSGCYQCDSKWMLPGRICFHCPCLRTYCCA